LNSKKLGLGKVPGSILRERVTKHIPLLPPGLDANPLPPLEDAVVSTNPALGVPLETLGFFAFHYAASNIAVAMARPRYATLTLLMPPESSEEELEIVAKSFGEEARKYGVDVVAGHTGVYKGLSLPVAVTTVIGQRVRRPLRPEPGDRVIIVGCVGEETRWLLGLTGKLPSAGELWRKLTPLPAALSLASLSGVKLMHDVSEGGVLGALLEISREYGVRLSIETKELAVAEGLGELVRDVLLVPSYGCLVVIASADDVRDVLSVCGDIGVPCSVVGSVTEGYGIAVNGESIGEVRRTWIDELYGEITTVDPVISSLERALRKILKIEGVTVLIPEVGMNIVYAREGARDLSEVAGLSGRVVKSAEGPLACGKVMYGGSRHVALVVLEALKKSEYRAAINIRGSPEIVEALKELGIAVEEVETEIVKPCPVSVHISRTDRVCRAYYHPGALGIEPTIVLLGKDPLELAETLKKLVRILRLKQS